jgi:hypothetical protein
MRSSSDRPCGFRVASRRLRRLATLGIGVVLSLSAFAPAGGAVAMAASSTSGGNFSGDFSGGSDIGGGGDFGF